MGIFICGFIKFYCYLFEEREVFIFVLWSFFSFMFLLNSNDGVLRSGV